jgi:hypothetical protein
MKPLLYGVMAYESASVAKIAKEKWDYVVHALQSRYDFELRLWKFDILRIPELRDVAINDAAKAQLVFVAAHGAGELPLQVKEWIEQWLALKNRSRRPGACSPFSSIRPLTGRGSPLFHSSLICNRLPGGARWISSLPPRQFKASRAPLDFTCQPGYYLRAKAISVQDAITRQK